jgi:hypothetical protein
MTDQTPDNARSQPAGEPAREKKEPAREVPAKERVMSDASATEKPAKTVPGSRTTKYVVTVDNITGLVLKVEKITQAGTKESAPMTTTVDPASVAATFVAPSSDPSAIVQAYYRGIADYVNALTTIKTIK